MKRVLSRALTHFQDATHFGFAAEPPTNRRHPVGVIFVGLLVYGGALVVVGYPRLLAFQGSIPVIVQEITEMESVVWPKVAYCLKGYSGTYAEQTGVYVPHFRIFKDNLF